MILAVCILSIVVSVVGDFHFPFNFDTLMVPYVQYTLIQQQLLDGNLPWWNMFDAAGLPLLFAGNLDLASIPLLYIFDVRVHLIIVGYVYLIGGIYFMYKFLRENHYSELLSLAGAVIWSFNGFNLWHLHELIFAVFWMCVPLVLLSLKRVFHRQNIVKNILVLVVATAFEITTGRWGMLEISVATIVLYILIVFHDDGLTVRENYLNKFRCIGIYFLNLTPGRNLYPYSR